jgi:hypothetical protein
MYDDAQIERYMLQQGGQWTIDGRTFGLGLVEHFKRYWTLLWPEDSQNWWTDLMLKDVLEHQFTVIAGPGSSWKSASMARLSLMDYSLYPECTTVLQSSTTMDDLRNRIYGETTKMWKLASERYDWFPGYPIDHKCVITTQNIDESSARDIRNGIIGIPCKTSAGKYVGMGKFVGRKNRRVWCIGDEFQFMELAILNAQDNLISNGGNLVPGLYRDPKHLYYNQPLHGYKCVFIGNTNPSNPGNPLDVVAEPENGWGSIPEDNKTKTWKCRRLPNHPVQCHAINLDGIDSPNTPYPVDNPRWPHLAGPHKLLNYAYDSPSYWSQGRGVFKFGLAAFSVLTYEICTQFDAFNKCIWDGGSARTRIGMLDAAYGGVGGDRCPLGWLEFGKCTDGIIRIEFKPWQPVPILMRKDLTPEYQIAAFCKEKMEAYGVPPENFFFDGRGSLAMAFAAQWSPKVNAVEFGGKCTTRPVGLDMFIVDRLTGQKRLKRADEHYSKFVTELWWSWRYAVESDQVRGLSPDMVLDAQPREYKYVAGGKIEIETKKEMKKRTAISPDLADMCFDAKTLVTTPNGQVQICELKQGDVVVTPFGNTTIERVRVRQSSEVTLVIFSNGHSLLGLGEHRIFCWKNGWIRLDSVSMDNDIESSHNLPIWKSLNALFTKDESSTFKVMVDTIRTGTQLRLRDFYTELSGKKTLAVFRLILTSITKTVIGEIIASIIWRFSTQGIILLIMLRRGLKTRTFGRSSSMLGLLKQQSGMDPKRGEHGTAKTWSLFGSVESRRPLFAKYAETNSKGLAFYQSCASALPPASARIPESGLELSALVRCVAANLWHSNTMLRRIALVTVRALRLTKTVPLYDLTLADHNAYYANGILVENCAIGIEGARRRGFAIGKLADETESIANALDFQKYKNRRDNLNSKFKLNYRS